MCGRFVQLALTLGEVPWPSLADELGSIPARYNLAPTQFASAVLDEAGQVSVRRLTWGFPQPHNAKRRYSTINATLERVSSSPLYRGAFRSRRCAVPMAGFYEWQDTPEGKQPFFLARRDGRTMWAAGLWDPRSDRDPAADGSFTVITRPAEDAFARVHNRMPVFLEPGIVEDWLRVEPQRAAALLAASVVPDVELRPVTRRVNSVQHDDRGLIEPIGPEPLPSGTACSLD